MADEIHIPPHSIEAEKSVLGSIMVEKNALLKVADFLHPEDFYYDVHGIIYTGMLELFGKRSPIDLLTVQTWLKDTGHLEEIGGQTYLETLANEVLTASHVYEHALIVKQKSTLRKLTLSGMNIAGLGYKEDRDVDELVDEAEQELFKVSQNFMRNRFVHIKDVLTGTYEKISDLHDPEVAGKYKGLSTGFDAVDHILTGLQSSDLIVLASRPSMGKTAFALNMALNIALKGKTVAIISLEMSKEQLVERLFVSLLAVDSWKMRTGQLTQDDFMRMGHVMDQLNSCRIFIDDSPGSSTTELRAKVRRLQMEHGLDMLIVDYLQLMSLGRSGLSITNRVQEISEISRSLKALARELHIPIMALSQLSRAVEQRPVKIPQLSDLRECVTGDTLVTLADGRRIPICRLVGQTPHVLAVTADGHITEAQSTVVWPVGVKPILSIRLASGRSITVTPEHRLFGPNGWVCARTLQEGDRLAIVRTLPEPKSPEVWPDLRVALLGQLIGDGSYLLHQPLRYTTSSEENSEIVSRTAQEEFGCTVKRYPGRGNWHQLLISGNGNRWKATGLGKWLKEIGIFGQRSHEKRLPENVFRLKNDQVGLLLRHLWATDGTISARLTGRGSHAINFTTSSRALAEDVAALLLRLGILARINLIAQGKYRPVHSVVVSGALNQLRFLETVGSFGPRIQQAAKLYALLNLTNQNTNVDTLPQEFFSRVKNRMQEQGISQRQMAILRGTSYGGTSHFAFAPSRATLKEYATLLKDPVLKAETENDLFWDRVISVEPRGEEKVFDLTVPGPSSWLADSILSHNSGAIEQDADVVMMMYREDYYEEDTDRQGMTDIFIRKHRHGTVGRAELLFKKEQMRFFDVDRRHTQAPHPSEVSY